MTTIASPRLPTRVDFAAKMKPAELELFDLGTHEAGHAIRGLLRGGEIATAGVYQGRTTGTQGRTRFRRPFDRHHIPAVAHAGPLAQAAWLHSGRPTVGQVDAVLADGGRCDQHELQQVYAASGGLLAVDHSAEEHLLRRCWPSVLALAASLYRQGEVDQDAVLASLGLTRANAAMGLAVIRSGESPRMHLAHQRF
ncbi:MULTISPECIES: hypothetical protein [Mycobacteroides]|uniref:hypothetical protein n=1 Tax=Mycobacteroides TaxID=670516 RepID=UPI0010413D3D|nr:MULTISPECIES: hypothetical protein [Mycobacteroides]